MRPKEIRELSNEDILEKLDNEKTSLEKLKLDHAVSDLENPNRIKASKKVIARLKTVLRERELESQKANNKK